VNKPTRSNILPMQNEQENQHAPSQSVSMSAKKRRFKGRRLLLIGFTAWACYVFFFVQAPDLKRLNESQQNLTRELQQVEETNRQLQAKIEQLQDPEYIAEIARKKYMMVKDGETLFVESKQ
jgi:cell division protein DivIC